MQVKERLIIMNPIVNKMITIFKEMNMARKISLGILIFLSITGLSGMFYWANQIEYQPLYSSLSPEDGAEVVKRLKELKIPYRLAANSGKILVPSKNVYEIRITLAGDGLPTGGVIGYELFDETDFGTTEFVQHLNYQRALQGELARTIKEMNEVIDAKVLIVMPKDSVFIEDAKPPSASVLLKLKSRINNEKVDAIVHLVASSLEGMNPDLVTVVDTTGNTLYKGATEEERAGKLANEQLRHKIAYEQIISKRIQTMLEKIVGSGKAIVRVTADMDFSQLDTNEEIFDPEIQLLRSRQNIIESTAAANNPSGPVSSVNPVVPPGGGTSESGNSQKCEKQNETVNYELNRTLRRIVKPVAILKRLSVAAVLDGTYTLKTNDAGVQERTYVARSQQEMVQFKAIVRNAMGYSEDREDQITVESFPFSYTDDMDSVDIPGWQVFLEKYGRTITNLLLVALIFIFVVLPVVKAAKEIKTGIVEAALTSQEEDQSLLDIEDRAALPDIDKMSPREKAAYLAQQDSDKSINILKGWLVEDS